jgi:hypothetical protein
MRIEEERTTVGKRDDFTETGRSYATHRAKHKIRYQYFSVFIIKINKIRYT